MTPIISQQDFLDISFKNISNHKIDDNNYLLIGEFSKDKGIKQDPTLHFKLQPDYQSETIDVWIWE